MLKHLAIVVRSCQCWFCLRVSLPPVSLAELQLRSVASFVESCRETSHSAVEPTLHGSESAPSPGLRFPAGVLIQRELAKDGGSSGTTVASRAPLGDASSSCQSPIGGG